MWTLLQPRSRSRESVLVTLAGVRGLLREPVWLDADPEQGQGAGVLLVPGFGFPDWSLTLTRGYRPAGARIGFNVGCTTDLAVS